ncbi:2-phosphosulfolactate phosphatase [Fulvivirga sp. RKSG066]|uniref:2-phosphosulfolactate phosphatase n=1 Tax=Fulvivirga aurantia TaxID=2529383 RepID=UPI0012BBDBD8|nr:2-phosphosulfolactate phosphatase [Fulvivirga aurantia]MTI22951.1 2-phosphosulfolactate phosphatase [Fulvivirga aurantia]
MKTVDVCLSPDLLHLHKVSNKIVVVVDILRATSCMTTGIAHGVNSIIPFADMEECMLMSAKGFLTAGERNGKKIDGFDLGNSPYDYMDEAVKGQDVAVTTTNGTRAIEKSKGAVEVVIGAFLNISAVAEYLRAKNMDVLILCAGWKGKVNLEDSLFAGALSEALKPDFEHACDAPMLAETSYNFMKHDIVARVQSSSHAKRLNRLNVHKDIEFCLKHDEYDVVPVLQEGKIVALNNQQNRNQ